jgi:hypothetical protein
MAEKLTIDDVAEEQLVIYRQIKEIVESKELADRMTAL